MSKQISLTVPDEVMRRAEVLAGHSGRAVAEVLTDAIEASLDPLSFTSSANDAIGELSDAQVLELADSTMAPADDQRLGELLDRKNERVLTMGERDELAPLMQIYQEGLLRKAQAIAESVRRGLRPSPAQ
jgi:predicted DNA-binding protein